MARKYRGSISSFNTSEDSDISFENTDEHIFAKIKRLQREENYIRQFLCKSITSINNGINIPNVSNDTDYHKFTINIEKMFENIKQMFEYVKTNTTNQNALKTVDVGEIKITILELEDKIKSLKTYLQRELFNLKRSEEDIKKNIRENPATVCKIKGRHQLHSMAYNQIVSSPVKEIITSSFKCLEVQEFQEFMANSENRCGGWNEYYHNLFIKIWNKYFQVDCNDDLETYISNVVNSKAFNLLLTEVLSKIAGFTIENIKSHCQWYLKYTYLKERQKVAIEKWREKKHIIKSKIVQDDYNCATQKVAENTLKLSSKTNSITNKFDIDSMNKNMLQENYNVKKTNFCQNRVPYQYTKPTKQWISRCQDINENSTHCNNDPASIKKIKIPKWRSSLQDIA